MGFLRGQFTHTSPGKGVEFCPPTGPGNPPFRPDPIPVFEPLEGRVEGALPHLENFMGDLLDVFRDCPAVERAGG